MTTNELFDNRPKNRKINRLPENPQQTSKGRFPSWLHRKLPRGSALVETNKVLKKNGLNTVCEEAKCPNRLECYSNHTATFLALGKECTRACGFCDIDFSKNPKLPEKDEPERIAQSVVELGLEHVVITSVDRDDLDDGGAQHFVETIEAIREASPTTTIEILTP
ncbi:MAG: lipoyl synthase, partial [Simkania sp.]|nr:lipoyl synthase [Simkania sp.]